MQILQKYETLLKQTKDFSFIINIGVYYGFDSVHLNCQNATAAAAATLREST